MANIYKHSKDWCHVCGERPDMLADVVYPENAEHPVDDTETEYIRICKNCAKRIIEVIDE